MYQRDEFYSNLKSQPILTFGTVEQKQKYLPRLASGDMIAAFCSTEASSGSDLNAIKYVLSRISFAVNTWDSEIRIRSTRARLSEDGRHWLISGEKTSINNGAIADLMIVFAKLEVKDVDDEIKDTVGLRDAWQTRVLMG